MPSTLSSNSKEALKTVISMVKWRPSYSTFLEFFPLVYIDFGTFVRSERSLHTVLTAAKKSQKSIFDNDRKYLLESMHCGGKVSWQQTNSSTSTLLW